MTKVDDLSVGQWVAITNVKDDNDDGWISSYDEEYDTIRMRHRDTEVTGHPLCILAMGLPFLCLKDPLNEAVQLLDVRRYEFQKLPEEYVAVLEGAHVEHNQVTGPTIRLSKPYAPEPPIDPDEVPY